jgi:hypothetical protein
LLVASTTDGEERVLELEGAARLVEEVEEREALGLVKDDDALLEGLGVLAEAPHAVEGQLGLTWLW